MPDHDMSPDMVRTAKEAVREPAVDHQQAMASQQGRESDRAEQQAASRATTRAEDRAADGVVDRSADEATDASSDHGADGPDRSADAETDHAPDAGLEHDADQPADRATDHAADVSATNEPARTVEQDSAATADQGTVRDADRPVEADRGEARDDQMVTRAPDEAIARTADQTVDISADRDAGEAEIRGADRATTHRIDETATLEIDETATREAGETVSNDATAERDIARDPSEEQAARAEEAWLAERATDREWEAEPWNGLDQTAEALVRQSFAEACELADAAVEATIAEMRDPGADLDAAIERMDRANEVMNDVRREIGLLLDRGMFDVRDPAVIASAVDRIDAAADRLFDDVVSEALERVESLRFEWTGKGLRDVEPFVDIDEPVAVANQGEWDNPANKRFLESTTNQATKVDLTEQRAMPQLATISLAEARAGGDAAFREAALGMLDRRFSEVTELAAICDAARAAKHVVHPTDNAANKDSLNRAIWRRIKRGATEDARLVREALDLLGVPIGRQRAKTAQY